MEEFWNRWQQGPKWLKQQPNISVGDIVLARDNRLPPLQWLLSRVVQIHKWNQILQPNPKDVYWEDMLHPEFWMTLSDFILLSIIELSFVAF